MERSNDEIDELDADERHDDATEAIDEQVALQDGEGAHRFVGHAAQGQRNQRDDDERVENDGAEDGAGGTVQVHDVERRDGREGRHQHGGNNREIFRHIVRDAEGRQRTARDQHLFPDLDDVEELGRVAVEVDHVAGFARGLRARVHRHADIRLSERGRVVRAVAGHGDEMTVGLFLTNAFQLLLRRRLRHEIIYARLSRDGGSGQRIVAGDHHRSDSHFAQLREALFDSAFDHVFELDHAERHHVRGDDERRAAAMRDFIDSLCDRLRKNSAGGFDKSAHRFRRAFADAHGRLRAVGVKIDAAHPRLRGERHECRLELVHFARAQSEFLFRQDDNGAAFRRFVCERANCADAARSLGSTPGAA